MHKMINFMCILPQFKNELKKLPFQTQEVLADTPINYAHRCSLPQDNQRMKTTKRLRQDEESDNLLD